MVGAVRNIAVALVTLLLFGLVIWSYVILGRAYVGLSGNIELVAVAIGLWIIKDDLHGAAKSLIASVERVAKK